MDTNIIFKWSFMYSTVCNDFNTMKFLVFTILNFRLEIASRVSLFIPF